MFNSIDFSLPQALGFNCPHFAPYIENPAAVHVSELCFFVTPAVARLFKCSIYPRLKNRTPKTFRHNFTETYRLSINDFWDTVYFILECVNKFEVISDVFVFYAHHEPRDHSDRRSWGHRAEVTPSQPRRNTGLMQPMDADSD